jgi:hypothetical protein
MSDSKLATVHHPIMSHPPIMTSGEITPKVVWEFENRCEVFFLNGKEYIPDDRKVAKILGCFEQDFVAEWASTEREHLIKKTLEEFLKEFRTRWLPNDWEQKITTLMISTRLDLTKQTFADWSSQILSHNICLRNYPAHMDEKALRTQLYVMLDEELRILSSETKISEITELRPWMAKIKEIDTHRQVELKCMAHFFDVSSARYAKHQNTGQNTSTRAPYPNHRNSYGRNNSSATPSSSTNTYPPRLTDEERCLLHDHEGCLKCREFYIGHCAAQCQVTLSGKDYKVHTLQDALRAKARAANRTAPIAAVTEDKTETTSPAMDLVAAVFPQSTAVMADKSMSDGSDASLASVSATPPLVEMIRLVQRL